MIEVKEEQNQYLAQFEHLEKSLSQEPQSWLMPVRKAAIARFAEMGFPTIRDEEWRYTNVAPIANTTFEAPSGANREVTPEGIAEFAFADAAALLVFVNGRYAAQLSRVQSLPKGVRIESLAAALQSDTALLGRHLARHADVHEQAFTALNTALTEDGAFVHVPAGVILEQPLHVLHVMRVENGPIAVHPRNLIVLGDSSQATIVETFAGMGDEKYFTNAVTEVVAGDNAVVDHYKIERESEAAFHVATLQLHTNRNSNLSSHTVSLGGALVRHDINAILDGEGGECVINGLYMLRGAQHVDNHLRVEHAKPHCNSREFFKGIMDGQSKGIFSGRIKVHKAAQKTDAKQTNMSLLLSEDAQVESKPQLEIFADDVKCTHGATIGQVNQDAIFYLRSRGMSEQAARSLLVFTFANESLDRIRVESLRAQLANLVFDRLPQGQSLRGAL